MSQNEKILNHLKQGRTLTPLEALHRFGCLRLAARVNDIKRMGHNIAARKVEANGKHFAEYRLT